MSSCETVDIIELFIGEPNRIRQQIVAPEEDPTPGPILDADVVYTIRKAKSYTAAPVGEESIDLPHVPGDILGWYEAIWPEAQSMGLKNNHSYWLHIHAPGYTQRLVECLALYRADH